MIDKIQIIGCREHNLKNISLELPKNKLIVFSGVSGSGKTSLAIDTIHAEGQRKYIESLSAYSRQFLGLMPKPDVDEIKGLSPSIAINQKNTTHNPRSIVGTVTEIYDYLRVFFARLGDVYSPKTGKIIKAYTVTEIADIIENMTQNSKLMILAHIDIKDRNIDDAIVNFVKLGYKRAIINGKIEELDDIKYTKKVKSIEIVVDRIISSNEDRARLTNSIELAIELSGGSVWIFNVSNNNKIEKYSTKYECLESGFCIDSIEPSMFSFNNPKGACDECKGIGEKTFFAEELIVPDDTVSIYSGAIHPNFRYTRENYISIFEDICKQFSTSADIAFKDIPEAAKKAIFYGISSPNIKFKGVVADLIDMYNRSDSDFMRGVLNAYKQFVVCPKCKGARLNDTILCVKINGLSIADVAKLSVRDAINYIKEADKNFAGKRKVIAKTLVQEILSRLSFLSDVGLEYISLNRKSSTLSCGEMQRITLASQLGSGLTGVLFVLDEPSIGLHPRDTKRLIEVLLKLKQNGNTIIVIEHEDLIIKAADYFVDVGPAAGEHGGQIVFSGDMNQFKNANTLTADYIFGRKTIGRVCDVRKWSNSIKLKGVRTNNLKNITVEFPLGVFCCVTGVSGSGKSSLVMDTLLPALKNKPEKYQTAVFDEVQIDCPIEKIIEIDQTPIGRTTRSNPITYIDGFTAIRELFAALPESKAKGYKIGRFSFNVRGGRCEACEGDGYITVAMHFLSDVIVKCDHCNGKRYNRETLEIMYNGKSIADVLEMSVDDAYDFFKNVPSVRNKLELLQKVGMGYIRLGQASTTISGGEAQRIKLAKELSKKVHGNVVYILDEPTTGLHFDDVKKLLNVLHALVDNGGTVIVVEHNIDVIKSSDWIIDLGVKCGNEAGEIAAVGSPDEIKHMLNASIVEFI